MSSSPIITESSGDKLDWQPAGVSEQDRRQLASMGLTVSGLNALCREYGIAPLEEPSVPQITAFSALAKEQVHQDTYAACAEMLGDVLAVQQEIGTAGTQMYNGQLTDPTPRYSPTRVRGVWGGWGLYEEALRGDPVIADAIQTHTEALVSADWKIQAPKNVPRGMRTKMNLFVKRHNAALKDLDGGGWTRFLEHACSFLYMGCAPFEPVYKLHSDGAVSFAKLAWRSLSTVHRWIMDPRQQELLVGEFCAFAGGAGVHYYLSARGQYSFEHKLMLVNIGALGNNFEGISPLRSCLVYIKLKQVLVQIAGVSAEVYGVPIATLRRDPTWAASSAGNGQGSAKREDLRAMLRTLLRMRSVDGPRWVLPDGVLYELHAPPGAMPDLLALIAYCDRQILMRMGLEGSMLGLDGQGGARSLGEQKDRESRRVRHYFARLIARPINEILRKMAREQIGELEEWPELVCNFGDDEIEVNAWIDSMVKLFGPSFRAWPKSVQAQAAEKLKMPPQIIAEMAAMSPAAAATPDPTKGKPARSEIADAADAPEPEEDDDAE